MQTTTRILLCATLLVSCAGLEPARPSDPAAGAESPAEAGFGGTRLYARDGSIVGTQDGSSSTTGPHRELAPSEGGRMYILELYQKAIDERDGLAREARTLRDDLNLARADVAERERRLAEAQARIEQMSAENKRLLDENIELAARLTTAQIRRLQVEKILLEARIAELSSAPAEQAVATSEVPAPVDKP
jgi:TolA-binding protein